jgi:hypothetical protein
MLGIVFSPSIRATTPLFIEFAIAAPAVGEDAVAGGYVGPEKAVDALGRGIGKHLEGGESGNRGLVGLALGGVFDRHGDHAFGLGIPSTAALTGFGPAPYPSSTSLMS